MPSSDLVLRTSRTGDITNVAAHQTRAEFRAHCIESQPIPRFSTQEDLLRRSGGESETSGPCSSCAVASAAPLPSVPTMVFCSTVTLQQTTFTFVKRKRIRSENAFPRDYPVGGSPPHHGWLHHCEACCVSLHDVNIRYQSSNFVPVRAQYWPGASAFGSALLIISSQPLGAYADLFLKLTVRTSRRQSASLGK